MFCTNLLMRYSSESGEAAKHVKPAGQRPSCSGNQSFTWREVRPKGWLLLVHPNRLQLMERWLNGEPRCVKQVWLREICLFSLHRHFLMCKKLFLQQKTWKHQKCSCFCSWVEVSRGNGSNRSMFSGGTRPVDLSVCVLIITVWVSFFCHGGVRKLCGMWSDLFRTRCDITSVWGTKGVKTRLVTNSLAENAY